MDPSAAEVAGLVAGADPLQALFDFVGIGDALKDAVYAQTGAIEKVRELVFIDGADWDDAMANAVLVEVAAKAATDEDEAVNEKTRGLRAREKGQIRMLRRYARLLLGLPGEQGALHAGSDTNFDKDKEKEKDKDSKMKRKFRLSRVVDQGDDQEVEALDAEIVRDAVKRFKSSNDGLDPTPEEEATADQLQGIRIKLMHDIVPFADFGILRPFGARLERSLKFAAKIWNPEKQEYLAKELPGPSSHAEWLRSWKVYSYILVALDAVSKTRLERYAAKISDLNRKYGCLRGDSWWLVALADQRMRSERMERLRREIEAKAAAGVKIEGGFDSDRPWDAVFLAAALDTDFWSSEVTEAALLFVADARAKGELLDPGHHVAVPGEARDLGGEVVEQELGQTKGP